MTARRISGPAVLAAAILISSVALARDKTDVVLGERNSLVPLSDLFFLLGSGEVTLLSLMDECLRLGTDFRFC